MSITKRALIVKKEALSRWERVGVRI